MSFDALSKTNVLYMGTPEISASVLRDLIEAGFNIVAVVTNEDKEVGRKRILEPTPVKKVALEHNIPVYQPHRIRLENDFIKEINPDLIITMAYGQIVPREVLDAPRLGCLNLHGSLLPKYRGAAPMQRAIIDGLDKTGVTLMEMVAAMDAGRMFDKEEVEILPEDNYTTLTGKIAKAASRLMIRDLVPYVEGTLIGEPQKEEEVTFAAKIKPEDEHLDLNKSSVELINYIRGLSETPGAYLYLDNLKLKIYQAHIASNETLGEIGVIVKDNKALHFQAKDGVVAIDSLQLEGKKKMDVKSFLNGVHGLLGKVLR